MSKELVTVLIDAVATIAIAAIGIWVVPEYKEFALTVVGALQPATLAVVLHFRSERKIESVNAQIRSLTGRM